jgi:hypothetical protein
MANAARTAPTRRAAAAAVASTAPAAGSANTAAAAPIAEAAGEAAPAVPINFEIQRAGRVFSAAADQGAPFFVGIQTHFSERSSGQSFEGLFNVPARQLLPLLYTANAFRPSQGFWADFIEPTTMCEGQNFLTLNTYDRARFTFGCGQFAAHVPDGDFVLYFREMLGLPEAEKYFPDLQVVNGRICTIQDGSSIPLESDTSTAPLMDYLNPSSDHIEDPEVVAAAKFIHWTTNHDSARQVQVVQMVATFKRLMTESDRRLGLDGRTADICCAVCDIRHQGRAKFPAIQSALNSGHPLAALLQIGSVAFADRIRTLTNAIAARSQLFTGRKWSRAQADFILVS